MIFSPPELSMSIAFTQTNPCVVPVKFKVAFVPFTTLDWIVAGVPESIPVILVAPVLYVFPVVNVIVVFAPICKVPHVQPAVPAQVALPSVQTNVPLIFTALFVVKVPV